MKTENMKTNEVKTVVHLNISCIKMSLSSTRRQYCRWKPSGIAQFLRMNIIVIIKSHWRVHPVHLCECDCLQDGYDSDDFMWEWNTSQGVDNKCGHCEWAKETNGYFYFYFLIWRHTWGTPQRLDCSNCLVLHAASEPDQVGTPFFIRDHSWLNTW